MRLRLFEAATGWRSLVLAALLYSSSTHAKKDAPDIKFVPFKHKPSGLSYFDDSDVIMFQDYTDDVVYRSSDAGATWTRLNVVPEGQAWILAMHPYHNQRAYMLTKGLTHYLTEDRGEHWVGFDAVAEPDMFMDSPLSFHADDPDRIIFNAQDCTMGVFCEEKAMYTTSGFKKDTKFLRSGTSGCSWAKSTPLFTTGQKDLDENRILCISKGKYSPFRKDYRLVISDNYFITKNGDTQEFEPDLEVGRTVQGVANMAIVKRYLLAAAMAENTDELALYVSDDTIKWHRAIFPHDHKLLEEAYTVLESTDYSLQIDVLTTRAINPMGVLLSSNSNGTYFTRNVEHTNRNEFGLVDFEKIAGIQGIAIANTVKNWDDVEKSALVKKEIITQISFDDGRTFQELLADKMALHLHSVTDASNSGRIFSSLAPGLVLGIGNTGDHLKDYKDGNMYVSDDAGETWVKALDGPHKYEFGDQGSILVAVEDKLTKKLSYSLNHGKTWLEVDLNMPDEVHPYILTTTADSTSLKFLLISRTVSDQPQWYITSLDFDDLNERQCKDDDLEKWYARVDKDGKPSCLMGHKQYYMRRKKDADCFLKKEFQDPQVKFEGCDCTDVDFECDYNFVRSLDRQSCIPAGPEVIPQGSCGVSGRADKGKGNQGTPGGTFEGSSGWRLIPGDQCKRTSGPQKDDKVEKQCNDVVGPPADGKIKHTQNILKGGLYTFFYLERTETSTGDDETVIMQTSKGVFLSSNHGKEWKQILSDVSVRYVIAHPFFQDIVYFLTSTNEVYYSMNRGNNINKFESKPPHEADHEMAWPMRFHPKHKDWIIWHGKQCNDNKECYVIASISTDRGDNWKTLQRYVGKCEFIYQDKTLLGNRKKQDKLIYCDARTYERASATDNPMRLLASMDFFVDELATPFDDIVDFATMAEFVIVAARDENNELKVDTTVDGSTFAEAEFPYNFRVPHQHAYTVLDSSTHSIFLHVTVETGRDVEYGGIIKSNSNGTSYVLSISDVNRDNSGYVDFEKMFGVEGVAMVNVVANAKTARTEGKKMLKTWITHNDAAQWALITPPATDADGKNIDCSGGIEMCSLHIHGYTERRHKSHTFSSPTAVGVMVGVGNVGEYLGLIDDKSVNTYITTDAGISWKEAKKGSFMWEFGDQGAIIVLVKDREPTNFVYYSRDEGKTWVEYIFADHSVSVSDITTLPSDNSRNFLLWASTDDEQMIINLDFTGLTDRQCKLDEDAVENDDYYLWSPKHPLQKDDCLFGHISEYHRKRVEADCYNGHKIQTLHKIDDVCECTRQDFECDYNFDTLLDGTCRLVDGERAVDHIEKCRQNPDLDTYWDVTGYRKIPISTCKGGMEMEYTKTAHPCPGKEEEFWRKRRLSATTIFFIVTISIAVASAAGYWVWRNWQGHFGQIRLGEQPILDNQAPYIKYPVMAISAVAAVFITLPVVFGAFGGLWRGATGLFRRGRGSRTRFTTRGSFARGADYSAVDEDEGELLGEDSDEEA